METKHFDIPLQLYHRLQKYKERYQIKSIHATISFVLDDRIKIKKEIKELRGKTIPNVAINRSFEIPVS